MKGASSRPGRRGHRTGDLRRPGRVLDSRCVCSESQTHDDDLVLPLARELAGDRRPRLEPLALDDGYKTGVFVHSPRGPARLPVLYLHGIQSHPGWFVGSAAYLADRGHAVFQVTRRGSGANRHQRGHAGSPGQLLRDVNAACRFVMERSGSRRLHVVGASWGGKLAAAWAIWKGRVVEPASVTMIAPGIVPRVDVALRVKLAVAMLLLVGPRKLFDIPLNDVELFTDNQVMREYLRGDPFRLHRATTRFLYASSRLDSMLRRAPRGSLSAAATVLLATRDRIIDNTRTASVVEHLTAGRAVVKQFDSAHVLEFQADPQPFYAALAEALARGQ